MSSNRPVPDRRLPNSGVAYHWLYQGWSVPWSSTRPAMPGLSPSDVPSGPTGTIDTTFSGCGCARSGRGTGLLGTVGGAVVGANGDGDPGLVWLRGVRAAP